MGEVQSSNEFLACYENILTNLHSIPGIKSEMGSKHSIHDCKVVGKKRPNILKTEANESVMWHRASKKGEKNNISKDKSYFNI
jgi:hypothetical protein